MTVKSSLDKKTEKQEKEPEEKKIKSEEKTEVETEKKTEETPPETKSKDKAPEEKKSSTEKVEEKEPSEADKRIAALEQRLMQLDWKLSEKNPADRLKVRSVEQLDPADVMKEPKIYFCFLTSYEMYGYTKNGIEILTPYGRPIKFTFFTRHERPSKSGKGMESISVSKVLLYSKKETEWVEKHPEFGNKVFSDAREVATIDITHQQKMSEISKEISQLDDHQVIVRAGVETLPIIQDVIKLRQQLIEHLAAKEVKLQRLKTEEEVKEMAEVRDKSEGLKTATKTETV